LRKGLLLSIDSAARREGFELKVRPDPFVTAGWPP
jgi:hypothetical protein